MTYARATTMAAVMLLVASAADAQGAKPLQKCAPDAVAVGTVCIDEYEASVWRVPNATTTNKGLVKKIREGKATAADLATGGAIQLGTAGDDYAPCEDHGQNCAGDVYAVSLAGVTPSAYLTWFQAQAACGNARKRLPSNAEWQAAVAGTPDPGQDDDGSTDCNTNSAQAVVAAGSRSGCRSARGAFDMIGNVAEWVAEWVPRSTGCGAWSDTVSPAPRDNQCLLGAASAGEPGALQRGEDGFAKGNAAGSFAIDGRNPPSAAQPGVGVRCAR